MYTKNQVIKIPTRDWVKGKAKQISVTFSLNDCDLYMSIFAEAKRTESTLAGVLKRIAYAHYTKEAK